MIKGREPGAPRGTPGTGSALRHGARGLAGGPAADGRHAADLGAIRRSDAIIDLLASRRRLRPRALRDPAVALLSSLAADVDAGPGHARPMAARPGPVGARPRETAAAAVAAAVATAAAVVAAAGLVVVVMLSRLSGERTWDRSRKRPGRHGCC